MKERVWGGIQCEISSDKFTLNQITKASWCSAAGAAVQIPQQYPGETLQQFSPFMHSYL